MASTLLELTADIVIAHLSITAMSAEDLTKEIKTVYATLEGLAQGDASAPESRIRADRKRKPLAAETAPAAPPLPAMTIEEAFKPDQVACMICGKTGMVTLKRHLATAHDLKPGKYRKQFNIPKDQPLAAAEYVAKRRQAALDRGLGDKLAAARAAKKAKQG
jgi:predicted transcriptional regulator